MFVVLVSVATVSKKMLRTETATDLCMKVKLNMSAKRFMMLRLKKTFNRPQKEIFEIDSEAASDFLKKTRHLEKHRNSYKNALKNGTLFSSGKISR